MRCGFRLPRNELIAFMVMMMTGEAGPNGFDSIPYGRNKQSPLIDTKTIFYTEFLEWRSHASKRRAEALHRLKTSTYTIKMIIDTLFWSQTLRICMSILRNYISLLLRFRSYRQDRTDYYYLSCGWVIN